MLLFSYG